MRLLRWFLFVFIAIAAQGANWYVRPTAQGSANGTSWSNAWSMANLNSNWASVNAGDTVWLAGGTYTTDLTLTKSGSSGNPIRIWRVLSTDATPVAAAGWQASFDSQVLLSNASITWPNSTSGSFVEIDGRIDRGIRSTVTNSAFGDANIHVSSGGHTNVLVRYVDCAGPTPEGGSYANQQGDGGNLLFTGTGNTSFAFEFCRFHGHVNAFYTWQNPSSGVTFSNCKVYDCGSSSSIHPNIMWMVSGVNNWTFINCEFWRWQVEGFSLDNASNWAFIGCVMHDGSRFMWILSPGGSTPQGPYLLYNNTFVNCQVTINEDRSSAFDSASISRNNIFWNAGFGTLSPAPANSSFNFSNVTVPGGGTGSISNGADPFVSIPGDDYRISGTIAANLPRNKGTPLPAPYNAAPYNVDANGVTRGADGAWDMGAFEFAAVGDPVPFLSTATIPSSGAQISLVFSEAIQFGAGGSGGWSLSSSSGVAVSMSTPTGTGASRTYALSRTVGSLEVLTIGYTQPGNGIEDTVAPNNDMVTFSGTPVTNNSTVPTAAAPTFSPASGSYFGTQNVIMTSSTPGATIRYTTDGTDPTAASTQYTAGATGVPTSASVTYKAKAFAASFLDSSITTATYEIGTWTSAAAWKNFAVPQQTGTFTWTFRASASSSTSDGLVGLSPVTSTTFTDLGPIIRFNPTGTIDVRNGGAYAAVNAFTYVAGTTYEFVCTINVSTRTYSVTVAQISGTPVTVATNYAFRSEQAAATQLSNVGMNMPAAGTITVSQMSFSGAVTIPALTSATIETNGTTLTLGFSVPVVYGTGGNGGWTITATGGAATLTPTASPTSFTISRPIAMGQTGTISYVQPGNGVEASTGGGDLASRSGFAFNNQSTIDLTAPTPNPMSFSSQPAAISSFSVTMTASVATDANTPPVQYYFDETSANPGGVDSGWQTDRTYTNTGLSPGIQYTYRVLARDSSTGLNQTTPSGSFNVTTPIIAGGKIITPAKETGAGFLNP